MTTMIRKTRSLRLAESERSLLKAAARRDNVSWSTWAREAALRQAVKRLEEDHPDLQPAEDDSGDREAA